MKALTQEELQEILRKHRLWLQGNVSGKRLVIHDLIMDGLSFEGSFLNEAVIADCSMRCSNLNGVNLANAVIERTTMSSAKLYDACCVGTQLFKVNLDHSDLRKSLFNNDSSFIDVTWWGAKTECSNINEIYSKNADISSTEDEKETHSIQVRLSENFGKWTEKIYDYYTELDLAIGDIVVVDTVYGAALGKVESFKEANKNSVLKWVVQKVDTKEAREKFEKLKKDSEKKEEQEEKLNKVRKEILARKKVLDETELIKYYAEKDIVMKGLLTQYNCMKKESEQ